MTLYFSSLDDFAAINEVYSQYFAREPFPARARVLVVGSPGSVSFDCIAFVPD